MTGAAARPMLTALTARRIGCEICGLAAPRGAHICRRCGAHLPRHGRRSLAPVWFWLIAGFALYIPANTHPMLISTYLGRASGNTIIGGVVDLATHGAWGVAAIVFLASVVVPIMKFLIIGRLALMAGGGRALGAKRAIGLYEAVEFIGRWSMIDVFVVAILAALVQMGLLARLEPGPAAALFALSVACTMFSARAFDPRLIWDRIGGRVG